MKQYYESDLKELQGQKFETVEACEEAEAKINAEVAKKQELAAKRKADAEVVDNAIKAEVEVKKSVYEKKQELTKKYLEEKQALDRKFLEDKQALDEELRKASTEVNNALKDFCAAHPEGYHSTIKFDDGSTRTYSYETNGKYTFTDLIDSMFNIPFSIWNLK